MHNVLLNSKGHLQVGEHAQECIGNQRQEHGQDMGSQEEANEQVPDVFLTYMGPQVEANERESDVQMTYMGPQVEANKQVEDVPIYMRLQVQEHE